MPPPTSNPNSNSSPNPASNTPTRIDLKKDRGLTLEWPDGTTAYYSIAYLRRMSPSADMKHLRDEMAKNPLTVLPAARSAGPLVAIDAELVGNYAIRIRFSDGHSTGIYSWDYLRRIDPAQQPGSSPPPEAPRST
ncbi:MAG: DUF971 domain-containing protein [Phycisphaeraceae bacterium]|nr:DUF971 domain-containing protein [Phycisphaeraceae bacterium]